MKNLILCFILLLSNFIFAQSVEIKDSAAETLMIVNDEGAGKSSITIPSSSSEPTSTTDKLYNESGTLKWGGSALGNGLWSLNTPNIYFDTGNVGIGTDDPKGALDVTSTTGALIVPRMSGTERNALTEENGSIIYNTDTGYFNFFEGGSWVTK